MESPTGPRLDIGFRKTKKLVIGSGDLGRWSSVTANYISHPLEQGKNRAERCDKIFNAFLINSNY